MRGPFDEDEAAPACSARPDELPLAESGAVKAGSELALRIEAVAKRIAWTIMVIFVVTLAYLYWRHRDSGVARPETPPIPVPHAAPVPPSA